MYMYAENVVNVIHVSSKVAGQAKLINKKKINSEFHLMTLPISFNTHKVTQKVMLMFYLNYLINIQNLIENFLFFNNFL